MNFTQTQHYLADLGFNVDLYRYLVVGGLIFVRLFILTMFIPFLGTKPIPGRVRISVSTILTLFFYSPLSEALPQELKISGTTVVILVMKEALFGILLGFVAGMVFQGIQAAGGVVDNQRQLANAQIFNPGIGSQSSLFGIFYYQMAIVIFLMINGHHTLFRVIARSFELVPILALPKMDDLHKIAEHPLLAEVIKMAAITLVISLQLAAPVLVAIFMADIILGLTNRVAPMVNVFDMGFNLKGFVGALLVYLSFPLLIKQIQYWFGEYLQSLQNLMELFLR